MRHFLLFTCLFVAATLFGQTEPFNYTGALNANGWSTHSGTAGQLVTLTTPSDLGNSLSYAGLVTSTGNRTMLVAGNGEDVNLALSGITNVGYFSFLLKTPNTTGLSTTGDYFTGFSNTSGAAATTLASRVFLKQGVTPGTVQVGIQNATGGAPTQSYVPTEYPVGTTLFIVVKYDRTTTPHTASIFVNPATGGTEPSPSATNNSGTAVTLVNFAAIFLRQNGNATTGTGNQEIDEIRVGSTWASVTPSSCGTTSTLNVTNCGPYTLNGTTYNASGTYNQLLAGANSAGCDSTITLNLTVNAATSSSITTSSCSSYTLNGTTYNSSGTYVQTIPNAAGCDSTITLNLTIVGSITYYADTDTDGFGDPNVTQSGCSQPLNYVTNADDCDDNNNLIGLGTTFYADVDADTYGDPLVDSVSCTQPVGYVANSNDCDDNNNAVGVAQSYYPDADGDNYGSASASALVTCTPPANYVTDNTDCNDANPNQYPGATEIPNNSVDEDCNGSDLNTLGAQLAQYTFTGNDCATPVHSVVAQPANATFSDYSADSVNCAAAADVFNYRGWNNSATVDSTEFYQFSITPDNCYELALTQLTFTHRSSNAAGTPFIHVRSSLDNFAADFYTVQIATPGVAQTENVTLTGPFASISGPVTFRFYLTGTVGTTTTYRHDNVSVYGAINALQQQTYYVDADGDGFGDAAIDSMDCTAPAGYVSDNTDCNDNNANENPNAVWYQDADNDTFGNSAVTLTQCTQPAGYVSDNTDCDDNNANVNGSTTYYEDADNDTYGNSASTIQACTQPVGYVLNANDCDDNNSAITVATDQFYIDQDNDGFGSTDVIVTACTQPAGYVSNADDCDDTNNTITLGSTFYEDGDNDGFGNANSTIVDCTAPNGYVADSTDCDDTNNGINPNATDVLGNSIDENCDGTDGNLGLGDATIATFNVFPNPGTTAVTITLDGSWNTNVTVTILSVDGKTVQTATGSSNEVTVATTELLPSVYFVRVSDGTHTSVARWVKQ
ncbi:MAG: T9SS type A sorting domain-containing protein [Flavobacteriia bacterium]|nr:T9SS type A sorting domain-containing protein [Flavobacteriia bacterium]